MKVWFHPLFETDLIEAAQYLGRKREGYDRRFLDAVEQSTALIAQSPSVGRVWAGQVRRFVLRRFRYTIRYRIQRDEGRVEFLSLVHTARHPRTGSDR